MRYLLAAAASLAVSTLAVPGLAQDQGGSEHSAVIEHAIADANRDDDRARDEFRHPAETLAFFEIAPDMKVGEFVPGGGWYSRVLGNYLGDTGQLTGLYFTPDSGPFDADAQANMRKSAADFPAKAAGWTGKPEASFAGFTLDTVPEEEKGTFDRVLVIRMLHNMMRWNNADSELKAMRELLKPDGMLGIVQHRAEADAPADYTDGNKGYLRQDDVVGFVEALGFELVGSSEINANPNDSADHPKGVWEMPPTLATKRDELENLGESDRMTLLFRKR